MIRCGDTVKHIIGKYEGEKRMSREVIIYNPWRSVILHSQTHQRLMMASLGEPCEDCGACCDEFKAICIHKHCERRLT